MTGDPPVDPIEGEAQAVPPGLPPSVYVPLLGGLFFHGLWATMWLFLSPLAMVYDLTQGAALAVSSAWFVLLILACCFRIENGEALRWALLAAGCFCRSGTSLCLAVALASGPSAGDPLTGATAVISAALLALTVGVFRSRRWFGVSLRDGWTTLRRRGGWVLLIGATADLYLLCLLISTYGQPVP